MLYASVCKGCLTSKKKLSHFGQKTQFHEQWDRNRVWCSDHLCDTHKDPPLWCDYKMEHALTHRRVMKIRNDAEHQAWADSSCQDVGIRGGCGFSCPAFLHGRCEEAQEIEWQDLVNEFGEEEAEEFKELYPTAW